MSQLDEMVAVYDQTGRVAGSASRERMRREGLWHAASAVLVLSPDRTSTYVHLRTRSKEVHPGMHDCFAGGVVAAGETPARAAERELEEELGVRAPLRFRFRSVYEHDTVRFHGFVYETLWDGPIVHQPEEVASGSWMPLAELAERLRDPNWPFVPDGRQFIGEWFRSHRQETTDPAGRPARS